MRTFPDTIIRDLLTIRLSRAELALDESERRGAVLGTVAVVGVGVVAVGAVRVGRVAVRLDDAVELAARRLAAWASGELDEMSVNMTSVKWRTT